MSDQIIYCEMHTPKHQASREFYARMFDWKIEALDTRHGPYFGVETPQGIRAGILPVVAGTPSGWVPYVEVADLDEAVARARKLGATVIVDRLEIPGRGAYGLLEDPAGAVVGLWQKLPPVSDTEA